MPLLQLMAANPDAVCQMNIEQIVKTAGDGTLRDNAESQTELREYLRQSKVNLLLTYSDYCLSNSFPKSGQVLQDIMNELGRRLEYEVINGRYQGTPREIGYDGIWRDPVGHNIVVEVKTTDAYRFPLDTVVGYRDQLLKRGEIANPCSVLIIVGRADTGELEAQVRGSRHAWDVRLISVDSLFNLVRVKESTDSAETIAKIRRLLTPLEYTRLDALVDVVFTTAQDVESSISVESGEQADIGKEPKSVATGSKWDFTPSDIIQTVRERIVTSISLAHSTRYLRKSRALYWDPNRSHRIVCTVSKRYTNQGNMKYWYAYHPQWSDFLREGVQSFFVLGCTDIEIAFVLPENVVRSHLAEFHVTERSDGSRYYHIKIIENARGGYFLQLPRASDDLSLAPFEIKVPLSEIRDTP